MKGGIKMKNEKLKSISCDPTCGFMVKSHNEKEVLNLAMVHAKKMHPDMKISELDLKKMMK